MGDQAFPIGWIASGLPTTGGRYAGWNLVNRALVDSIIIDRSLLAGPGLTLLETEFMFRQFWIPITHLGLVIFEFPTPIFRKPDAFFENIFVMERWLDSERTMKFRVSS